MATRSGVNKRRVSQVMTSSSDIPSMSFMEEMFGEEFPEAFGSGAMKSRKTILDLPAELLAIMCEDLSRLEIKRLRCANTYLARNVDLRIDRVFVSPNRANLTCLRQILDHPRYRSQVFEVVWDDAQLDEYPDLESFRAAIVADEDDQQKKIERQLRQLIQFSQEEQEDHGEFAHDDLFDEAGRLTELAKDMLLRHDSQISRDLLARNATVMGIEESYEIYQELYQEEKRAIKQGYDAAALRHVLAVCPKLERIVLTSEIWRPWHHQPIYHTPLHRSLPPGFRKPSVWPWLSYRPHSTPAQAEHRRDCMRPDGQSQSQNSSLPSEFRGYSTIVSALIDTPASKISEFIIYSGHEPIGITHQLFAAHMDKSDFTNTMTMARTVPLRRLQLTLNSWCKRPDQSSFARNGKLRSFLGAMQHLEHLDLAPNLYARRRGHDGDDRNVSQEQFLWKKVIPQELLSRLKTFALRNVFMPFSTALELIQSMTMAQHITLDNIMLHVDNGGSMFRYYEIFRALWMHYDRSMDVTRPAFTVIQPIGTGTKSRMVCEELCEYLHYGDYERGNPFRDDARESMWTLRKHGGLRDHVGWVMDDRDERFMVRAVDYERVMGRTGLEDEKDTMLDD
jgi:hypothetical protein